MIRLLFRLLGIMALAGAFVMAVVDGTSSIAAGEWVITGTKALLVQMLGDRFALIQPAIERHMTPLLWDPVLVALLGLPVFAVLALLGALLILATGKRRPTIGFSSRP